MLLRPKGAAAVRRDRRLRSSSSPPKPLVVTQLRRAAPESSFGAVFLLGVLVVSAGWGMWLAVATSLVSAVVYVHFHMETHGAVLPVHDQDIAAILVFLPVALLTNILVRAGQDCRPPMRRH